MNDEILIDELNTLDNWEQVNIIHCKAPKCKGMLLESLDTFTYKCSDCGKYWDDYTEWKELKKTEVKESE